MHTFAQKPKATQPATSAKSTILRQAHFGQSREANSNLHLQRAIGNQVVQQQLETNTERVKGNSGTTGIARFGHDFSRIPVYAKTPAAVQPRLTTSTLGHNYDSGASDATCVANDVSPIADDVATLRLFPIQVPVTRTALEDDIPVEGADEEMDEEPPAGGAPGGAPTPAPTGGESCGQPRSMNKITSGAFLGGLTINDYYPDLASRGYPATAGPFNVGNRAGASVQLYGVIPSPCLPNKFTLAQTVTRTRLRRNGVADPTEGQTFDDIAKSGRDSSRAPFRQEFLGGGTAPLGYIISMADPPSVSYNSSSNIERDLDFVTSLVGPGGRQSITWSLSTRISGGTVTSNVVS